MQTDIHSTLIIDEAGADATLQRREGYIKVKAFGVSPAGASRLLVPNLLIWWAECLCSAVCLAVERALLACGRRRNGQEAWQWQSATGKCFTAALQVGGLAERMVKGSLEKTYQRLPEVVQRCGGLEGGLLYLPFKSPLT